MAITNLKYPAGIVCWALTACLILYIAIYVGRADENSYGAWAYHVGNQPFYRLLFLIAIVGTSLYSFPVALLLLIIYASAATIVPTVGDLDETFLFGAPVSNCGTYNTKSTDRVGTTMYPLNDGVETRNIVGK
jgi:hypothetical protein